MEVKSKFEWADNIRFFAVIAVIILHVAATAMYYFNQIPLSYWLIADFTVSAMRFRVPFFLMISGALLLREDYKPIQFYKKRLKRVLFPFLFWSFIYSIIVYAYTYFAKGIHISLIKSIENIIFYRGIFHQTAYHFWYFYVIIGIYLITPFFRIIVVKQRKNTVLHFIFIWLIIIILNAEIFNFNELENTILQFLGYSCYFISGYYLSNLQRKINSKMKTIQWILVISLILFTGFATYLITLENNKLDQEFYKYMSPNIILMSLLLFVLFANMNFQNRIFHTIRDLVNKYSYGIFLSHVLILWAIEKVGLGWNFIHPLIGIPLGTLLVLSISFVIVYLLNKIPLINKFVG